MLSLLEGGGISVKVKERAKEIFRIIAGAESSVHGKDINEVHFHEIAGLDTIIDIVGVCVALDLLGVESISASAVAVGSGFIDCAHGRMSLPAPATAKILQGVETFQENTGKEICTPTGAALIKGLAQSFGTMPQMKIEKIGFGAGKRNLPGRSNTVKLVLGEGSSAAQFEANSVKSRYKVERVVEFKFAVDDITPEVVGFCIDKFISEGALDAYVAPLVMKKGRAGFEFTVLCKKGNRERIAERIFSETSTFGVRMEEKERLCLERKHHIVKVEDCDLRIKIGLRGDVESSTSPEFEDCKIAAEKLNMPLKKVYNLAIKAYMEK
jgi:hypothetical protein